MSKQKKKGLVPELRFPEYQDNGGWDEDKLSELVTTVTPPKKLSTNLYQDAGQYPIIDQSQSNICGWTNDKESLISDNFPLIIFGDHTCILKMACEPFAQGADGIKILKAKDQVEPEFLYQTLQVRPVVMEEYKRHFSILKERIVGFPEKESGEQQKIADCLTSVDDLITAQTQKLDALKTHKKGLMQQLFPAEGETVPELRFPEFRDAGEWEGAKLGEKDIAIFVKERIPLDQLTLESYVSTENLLPDYAGVTTASNLPSTGSFTQYKKGDILVSNIRPYLKKVWAATIEGGTSNDVIVIRAKSKVRNSFLAYLLRNDEFINYVMKGAKGVKMPRGDISLIKEYPVAIPTNPKEQQKITDCLSSIDELITAQTHKIAALKTHKKGLMQQLFPSVGGVAGEA